MSQADGLALIRAFGDALSPRQLAVLAVMAALEHDADADGELVRERGHAYLGEAPVASRTVNALLRACAISDTGQGGIERYVINSTGHEILARHAASSH
jgi:hypothetical protein